ncbi:CHASE3 domain-containing protein [Asticcacaulis sp. SL142]|uniref:methyl-accepting chemotaxis protein n=1 Tax=Asticcacaulis sp. SL142 TaxID=2995155 RepID=UPI00226CA499|nr:CHASE3 domain-containing protein [Asticcacaulis sp. SL142]WAC47301.1 CHASE3 domain-containing protein [Asticcacaulis sp. SL142]
MARFLTDLKVLKKIGLAFAAIVITSLCVSATIWIVQGKLAKSAQMTTHTYNVLDELTAIQSALINQETGLRGYLVSGDQEFLEPFHAGAKDSVTAIANVRKLTADNPEQQARLDEVEALVKTWKTQVAAKELELMADPATQEQARSLEGSGAGKASMDGLRKKIGEMAAEEKTLLSERTIEAQHSRDLISTVTVAGGLIILAISVGALAGLNQVLVKPLVALTKAMQDISRGVDNIQVPGTDRKDELGDMSKAFDANAQRIARIASEQAETEARQIIDRRNAILELADSFERNVGGIVELVSAAATEMQASASQLTATAQETSAQSAAVSGAAEEAGANVTSVASAAEELGASVGEIGRQVSTSSQISHDAVRQADAAGSVVNELNEVAASIGGVVDLIAGLAGQTNLLALNATIESARAGEAGRGFAVVASEVKALAAQTSKATEEISRKINQIQGATAKAAEAFQNITGTIQNINSTNAVIASAVEQQSAATQEIIAAVNQASMGTQEVTLNISGVAQASEQTGEAATQVLASSGELAQQAERLQAEMDKFLQTVRAA